MSEWLERFRAWRAERWWAFLLYDVAMGAMIGAPLGVVTFLFMATDAHIWVNALPMLVGIVAISRLYNRDSVHAMRSATELVRRAALRGMTYHPGLSGLVRFTTNYGFYIDVEVRAVRWLPACALIVVVLSGAWPWVAILLAPMVGYVTRCADTSQTIGASVEGVAEAAGLLMDATTRYEEELDSAMNAELKRAPRMKPDAAE